MELIRWFYGLLFFGILLMMPGHRFSVSEKVSGDMLEDAWTLAENRDYEHARAKVRNVERWFYWTEAGERAGEVREEIRQLAIDRGDYAAVMTPRERAAAWEAEMSRSRGSQRPGMSRAEMKQEADRQREEVRRRLEEGAQVPQLSPEQMRKIPQPTRMTFPRKGGGGP